MEGTQGYAEKLAEALTRKHEELERKQMPRLKEDYRLFYSAFQGVYNILQKKALVQEDPYKQDEKISEIKPPSSSPYAESDRDQQMSIRLSQFDNQLDFVNNYTQFDLENMDLKRLKNLGSLVNYIRWHQLSPHSNHPPTRAVAEYFAKLRSEADPLSAGVVKDGREQLAKQSRRILKSLKGIANYRRQEYKLDVLQNVLPQANVSGNQSKEEAVKRIKKAHSASRPGHPFYGDLVEELLEELRTPERQQETLDTLQVEEDSDRAGAHHRSLKPMLFESLRTLARVSRALEDGLVKLQENVELLEMKRRSLWQRFRDWIDRLTNKQPESRVFDVEYIDESTSAIHTETIEFDEFVARVGKKARLCAALLSRASGISRKLEEAPEDQVLDYLRKQLFELHVIRRQMESLDTHVRSEVPREHRGRLRGINVELQVMSDALSRANTKKRSYVAQKEEEEQLKKLSAK